MTPAVQMSKLFFLRLYDIIFRQELFWNFLKNLFVKLLLDRLSDFHENLTISSSDHAKKKKKEFNLINHSFGI